MESTVKVLAGERSNGSPVFEEVLVAPLASNTYRLLASPGVALGMAADDVFVLAPTGEFEVVSRGGNICVQIFCEPDWERFEQAATDALSPCRGRLDGKYKTARKAVLVYTVPVSAGFSALEEALNELMSKFPGSDWIYGNVYDPKDGVTPLNWWSQ